MADTKINWRDIHNQIYAALDIPSEFEALGVHLANGRSPNGKGWIECHAINCEDRSPSAGVCVSDGEYPGRYSDFRDPSRSCFLLEFAVRCNKGTFSEVLKHYAHKANVKLPNAEYEWPGDRLDFRTPSADPSFFELKQYAEGKPGVTVRAIKEVGAKAASMPKNLPPEKRNNVFAFPMYGTSALINLDPTGWHCVASHPAMRIRKYRGPGNPEDMIKTQTFDEYGLMNVDGLIRLAEATVVNLVEGITDLLTGQAAISPWRDEDPDNRKHVVLSAGSCSSYIKPEWLQHFAGKEVRIWFDVGDPKNEGQTCAAVNVGRLAPVCKAVRNVVLPLGKDGGKNDLRAWLTEEGANRGYAEMDQYAKTFTPVEAGSQEAAGIEAHEALLKNLGLMVIGEHEGTQWIEVYCDATKKSGTIHDIDKLTVAKLIQYVGAEPVQEHIHEGKEPQPPKMQLKDVRNAIAAAASDQIYFSQQKHGAGLWLIGGQIVLVKARCVGILKGTKIETSGVPFYDGHILDTSQSTGDWVDFGVLERYLNEAQRDEWCQEVFEEAVRLFRNWYWREQSAPEVVASLAICTWLQTLWPWRPEIFITGGSDTGKSMFVEDTLSLGLFADISMHVQKPTAAAICQHLRHHGRILIIDEFEHDQHRQSVLELLRVTSRGGRKIRGTADHRGISFVLRHIPWLAGIEMGLRKQADRNRFIVLNLKEIPPDVRGRLILPTTDQLKDLGLRLLAIGLRHYEKALLLATQLKAVQVENVPGRVVENFSLPAGMFAAIYGLTLERAQESMREWFRDWDFTVQSNRDDVNVVQEILTSEVIMQGGSRTTVSKLLDPPIEPDAVEALARVGIKRICKRGAQGQLVIFFAPSIIQRHLLKGSEYQGHSIEQYLMRLKGAKEGRQQRLGSISPRGIEVPWDTIEELFANKEDDQPCEGGQPEPKEEF